MAPHMPWIASDFVANRPAREPCFARRKPKARTAHKGQRFPKFQELPSELRLAIWKFALLRESRMIRPRFVVGRSNMGDLAMPSVPTPKLIRACREAREANAISPKIWVDLCKDILFFTTSDYRRLTYLPPPEPSAPVLAKLVHPLSAYNTHHLALECDGGYVSTEFIMFMVHCQKLTRLFLVISCERPTQRVLDAVWRGAVYFHKEFTKIAGSSLPLPEVVFLLKRRNYDFQRGVESVDSEEFFSNFTVVPYKPGHRAKIGSHGVLKSVLPI